MKIKIRKLKRIPFDDFMLFLALLAVYSTALLEHVSVPIPTFSAVKFPILYVGGLCLFTQVNLFLRNYKKRKYFYLLAVLFLFCAALGCSAYANRVPVIGINPTRITLRIVLYLIELFLLVIWVSETGKSKYAINVLFWYILILVLVTDVLFFTRLIVFKSGRFENYLVGTKFTVAYMHMNLLTLWFTKNNLQLYREGKSKRFVFLAIPIILAVSIRVDCMTGVLGCLVLFVLFMMLNTKFQKKFLYFGSPVLLWAFLVGSVLFPFLAERIVSIPFVSHIVEDILGRDPTLTGRLLIFRTFGDKMSGHWLWGYGYGNGNMASEWLFRCANAQNAQLHWILQSGLIATILIGVMMTVIIKQMSKSARQRSIMPLAILVYVYIILGTVETTFNMSFFLWLACIFMHVNEKNQKI